MELSITHPATVLSYLERRWLSQGFGDLSIIKGRYIEGADEGKETEGGSHGGVETRPYNEAGIPSTFLLQVGNLTC
jgi:hypothetical protein